jgi:hypothetical protein
MNQQEIDEYLSNAIGIVDANSFEVHMLWKEATQYRNRRDWEQIGHGYSETVGHLNNMPVCVSVNSAIIDGHKIIFIDAKSRIVDHRMIDTWLEKTFPKSAFKEDGRINRTNADGFHNIFPSVNSATKEPVEHA